MFARLARAGAVVDAAMMVHVGRAVVRAEKGFDAELLRGIVAAVAMRSAGELRRTTIAVAAAADCRAPTVQTMSYPKSSTVDFCGRVSPERAPKIGAPLENALRRDAFALCAAFKLQASSKIVTTRQSASCRVLGA